MIILSAGCVSTKTVPLADKDLPKLNGSTLTYVSRERPDFGAMTAGKAMGVAFGAIGGAIAGGAMVSAGNHIVQENDIADPANHMAQSLGADLVTARSLSFKENNGTITKTNEPAELVKAYPGTDFLLDVRTYNWGFGYFPTSWSHYRVLYAARLQLLDSSNGKILAAGNCVRGPEKTSEGAPTYDELLADHAARLKAEIAGAAEYCITEFKGKVLKLPL